MANWRDEVLLEGDFVLLPKKKVIQKVNLTRRGLFFNPVSNSGNTYEEKFIQISDIIGCHSLEPKSNGLQSSVDYNTIKDRSSSGGSSDSATEPETFHSTNIGIPKPSDPSIAGFIIFAYPFRKKVFSGKKVRHRVVLTFSCPPSNEVYEERRKTAELWKNVLNCLCRDIHVNKNDILNCVPPPRGKLFVLINPHSGPGKAHSIFKNEIAPMLQEANIPYKEFVTEYAGHASDLMREISLTEWHGIVVVSGDGLIFEAINGIMSRGDWASSITLPIGCLPGGSGNALCCSINYSAGEPVNSNLVLHSTFVLIKHRVVPMDLVMVHLPDKTLYSFLSLAWGIVADIDFESEKYRNLGEARFTVGAVRRILGLRTYRGKVSFLPVAEYVPRESSGSNEKILSKVRRFSLRSRSSSKSTLSSSESSSPKLISRRSLSMDQSNYSEVQARRHGGNILQENRVVSSAEQNCHNGTPEIGQGDSTLHKTGLGNSLDVHNRNPYASGGDDSSESFSTSDKDKCAISFNPDSTELERDLPKPTDSNVILEEESSSTKETSRPNSNVSSQEDLQDLNENATNISSSPFTLSTSENGMTVMAQTKEIVVEEEMYQGHKKDYAPVPSPLLPPLNEPVPGNWVKLEGEFVLVCALYQTHLGSEMLAAPDAHLNDGFIHLMIVREGISRNALLNLFLSFSEGAHIHSPYVEFVKVLAMRLEPESDQGNLMIDGERFNPSSCQAQILPGIAKVMAIK